MRHLNHNAGAVARLRVRARRAAMAEVDENFQAAPDYGVGLLAPNVRRQADAASLMLERWMVKPVFGQAGGVVFVVAAHGGIASRGRRDAPFWDFGTRSFLGGRTLYSVGRYRAIS